MSLQLLEKLNGNKNGALLKFINSFKKDNKEPQIAWYPSAGEDFRDVLYLSKSYYQKNTIENIEIEAPDIFIHTDYLDGNLFDKNVQEVVYYDYPRTTIRLIHKEQLKDLHLTLDGQIIDFPNGNEITHKVIFTILAIDSHKLGKWEIPLIYVFSENAAFVSEFALPNNAKFTHIINVAYGGGCGGGGRSSGIWIKNILRRIGCKILITDDNYFEIDGDLRVYELFPNLTWEENCVLRNVHITPVNSWVRYGDIYWQLVS